jgi:glycosyltransferase involved in cell wall biosynthesis/2-polyprenyl-3-methyl-5-hydroxy-6-metoxy-1,4-benzoquinol methylase
MAMKVVITMPAYRAEDTLERTVADIPAGVADTIILVDDASPDNTVDLARELGITVFVHLENKGYGGNQKTCYGRALDQGADIVVLLHPDYQYDPKAVPLLIAPIVAGHADMTFGSRFAGLSDPRGGGMPLYRYFGNRVTTTLENFMLGSRFTEMHSGLRAYTREFLLTVPFLRYTDDFSFDSQLLIDAVTAGQRVVEVPIPTRYTQESSSISVVRSLRYVAHTLGYCAARAAKRGRQGRRSPLVRRSRRLSSAALQGNRVANRCFLCGNEEAVLLYPGNVSHEAEAREFSCTCGALSQHDDIVKCTSCGMVSARPTLGQDEILQRYGEVVDENYLSQEVGRRELFEWVLDVIAGYYVPGGRLFEVGSNVGLFLATARDRGWEARGIEPSRWAVQVARERFQVDIEQLPLEELDQAAERSDAVVLLDVLEHFVDPLEALRRLRFVVDDEGILVLSTINFAGLHSRLRKESWPWLIRPHLHYFTPTTLRRLLELAGFRMVEWQLVPRSFHLSYIARRGRSNLGLVGAASERLAKLADVRVPVGWLGDVVLVVARPANVEAHPVLPARVDAIDTVAPRASVRGA